MADDGAGEGQLASPQARGDAQQQAGGEDAAAQAAAAQAAAFQQEQLHRQALIQQLLQQHQASGAPPPGHGQLPQQQASGAPPPPGYGWPPGVYAGGLAAGYDPLAAFVQQADLRFAEMRKQQLDQQQALQNFMQQAQQQQQALTALIARQSSGAAPASRARLSRSPAVPFQDNGAEPDHFDAEDARSQGALSQSSTAPAGSLADLVGDADPDAIYDPLLNALSPSWRAAILDSASQVPTAELPTVNTIVAAARALDLLRHLLYSMIDSGAVSLSPADQEALAQVEEAVQVAHAALTERLGHYQCLAAGMDAKSAEAMTAVARFKRRTAAGQAGAVGRLPCVDACLADLYEALARKHVEQTFHALHEHRARPAAPSAKASKPAPPADDDELETVRAELEKIRGQNKKLEFKLSQAGRDKTSRDKDAPPPPKKTDKSKSSGESDAGAGP